MSGALRLEHGLERQARRHGERPCLIEPDGSCLTYAELDDRAAHVAAQLAARGVARGAPVLLVAGNSPCYVAALFGILKAGAVAVPQNPLGLPADLDRVAADAAPCLVITDPRAAPLVAATERAARLPALVVGARDPAPAARAPQPAPADDVFGMDVDVLATDACAQDPGACARHTGAVAPDVDAAFLAQDVDAAFLAAAVDALAPDADVLAADAETAPAVVMFTSGSTGRPKGVVLTHRNLIANTRAVLAYLRLAAADRGLAVLPFSYVYGQSVLFTHLWAGASLVIEPRTAYPQLILEALRRHQVSGLSGVPSTFLLLLDKGDFAGLDLPRLRYLTSAGGHLPWPRVAELAARFPRARIFLMYGATEAAGRISYLPPDRWRDKPGSIGLPIAGVEMRVWRDGAPAAPGEEGEIHARGATFSPGVWPLAPAAPSPASLGTWPLATGTPRPVSPGAWRLAPAAPCPPSGALSGDTPAAGPPSGTGPPAGGWHATGDLGYQDREGFFFLTGRAVDRLKIGGHRVSAAEIERALCDTGLVAECAVIGCPDPLLGERAEAYLVAASAGPGRVGVEAIRAALAARLPAFKMPSRFHLVAALPHTANGKIAKGALAAGAALAVP